MSSPQPVAGRARLRLAGGGAAGAGGGGRRILVLSDLRICHLTGAVVAYKTVKFHSKTSKSGPDLTELGIRCVPSVG